MKNLMGLGYRAPFYENLIEGHPNIGWLEVITENYLWDKGVRRQNLERLRKNYDIAFHGVSLSIAAPEDHDKTYIKDLKRFCDELSPVRVSDHLCWSSLGGHSWHDLLPFPYTKENLRRLSEKVSYWQDELKRPLCLENLSAYIQSAESEMSEYEFLAELCKQTSCRLLLDVNNMIVNAKNFNIDPHLELKHLDLNSIDQIHLAGHIDGSKFAIDTHSTAPNDQVWSLFEDVMKRRADIPTMIEWDADIPDFLEVSRHLDHAQQIQKRYL